MTALAVNTALLRDLVWLESGVILLLLIAILVLGSTLRTAIGLVNRPSPATRTAEQRSGRDRRVSTERRSHHS